MTKFSMTLAAFAIGIAATNAQAAVTAKTYHGAGSNDLDGRLATSDLISGLIATELTGDTGWHPANTNPADQLPVLTNDSGQNGLAGLLNDFPPVGQPTKRIQYDLATPSDIGLVRILTGNDGGDGRIFSSSRIFVSTDNGLNFDPLGGFVPTLGTNAFGYYQSDPSGTVNNAGSSPRYNSTVLEIFDDQGGLLASGVTNIQFEFFGVDNTLGEMRDPFDGNNPWTGVDDGLTAPNTSPLVWEIDVQVPEPTSCLLLLAGLGTTLLARRSH